MQSSGSKKTKSQKSLPAEKGKTRSGITSPETYLDARLARERSPSYSDPFAEGPEAMANYLSAFSRFVLAGGIDNDFLGQLFIDRIAIRISKNSEGGIEFDRKSGRTTLILPNIPRQSPKIRAERIEKLSIKMTHALPIAYFHFFSEIIRGMPEEARHKLLLEYSK